MKKMGTAYEQERGLVESDSAISFSITSKDQSWSDFVDELWEKWHIIYDPNKSVHPIMLIKRDSKNYFVVIGNEDDGYMWFEKEYGQYVHSFHPYWIDGLIEELATAKRRIEELQS